MKGNTMNKFKAAIYTFLALAALAALYVAFWIALLIAVSILLYQAFKSDYQVMDESSEYTEDWQKEYDVP
jgi:hypothetical protein